jgi:uncharacterized membrane protein (DUF4010 family)
VAANAIAIGALSNTVVKAGMVMALATAGLKRRMMVATGVILIAGVVVLVLR